MKSNRGLILKICLFALCAIMLFGMAACGEEPKKSSKKSSDKDLFEQYDEYDKTLAAVGTYYAEEDRPMTKIRTLDDIYLPEGLLATGFGMWIYNNATDGWVRTNSEEGRALFRQDKPTFISSHGMGSGAYADDPENFYAAGYNVLAFHWGAYANEVLFDAIVDKVWIGYRPRWQKEDDSWESNDVSDASTVEVYGAYYYDLFKNFPKYSGSSIHLFGHSYGGMLSIGVTNFLITAFKCKLIPAYMLPDKVSMLDPYMMRCSESRQIPWLGKYTPAHGNICEIAYQTALEGKKLGITIQLTRFNLSVAYMAVLHYIADDYEGDLNISYWNFINNVVYAHLEQQSIKYIGGLEASHNYGWDWFTEYYTGNVLYDAAATLTQEQALCFGMDYATSFARAGIKYSINVNGTKNNTDDDILTSFFREYKYDGDDDSYPNSDVLLTETAEERALLTGKAKIAGFVYFDRNGNGTMDERLRDHLSGATVVIKDSAGNEILNVVTEINGYYEVEVDTVGEYTVTVELPEKYVLSTDSGSLEANVTIIDAQHQLVLNHFGAKK